MKTLDEYKLLEQKWSMLAKETCPLADLQELQASYSNLTRNGDALRSTRQAAMVRSVQITQLIELRDMQDAAKKIAARGEDKARAAIDRKSTRLNSSHCTPSRMPSSA